MQSDDNPLVSILIPLYNDEEYIGSLLEWCLRQPYKNIEVVVVDDHSTDNSYKIAKSYECDRIHVLVNPKKGSQSARNYAFQNSHGKYVKFHDADDYCSDNIIVRQVERMTKDGDEDTIVFSSMHILTESGRIRNRKPINDRDFENPIDFIYLSFKFRCGHNPHCFLLNRRTVEKVGGWKEDVLVLQDILFFTKAVERASKLLYVENEYAMYRLFEKGNHLHIKTPENTKNSIHTICELANTLLRHRDDEDTRAVTSTYIGLYIYIGISQYRHIIPYVDKVCQENGLAWTRIKSKNLGLLYAILGWTRATCLIQSCKKHWWFRYFHH